MAIHSSTLVWKFPWTEESGRLQSMGLQRVGHDRGYTRALILFCCTLFIVLHRYCFFFFFYRLQLCSNLSPCTSVSTFSSTIYSLHISMPHFGNSCNTLSSLTIVLIRVVWDQGSLMLPLPKYYYSLKSQTMVNISEK